MGFSKDIDFIIGALAHGMDFTTAYNLYAQAKEDKQSRRGGKARAVTDVLEQAIEWGDDATTAQVKAYAQASGLSPAQAKRVAALSGGGAGGVEWTGEDHRGFIEDYGADIAEMAKTVNTPEGLQRIRDIYRDQVRLATEATPEEWAAISPGVNAAIDSVLRMAVPVQTAPDGPGFKDPDEVIGRRAENATQRALQIAEEQGLVPSGTAAGAGGETPPPLTGGPNFQEMAARGAPIAATALLGYGARPQMRTPTSGFGKALSTRTFLGAPLREGFIRKWARQGGDLFSRPGVGTQLNPNPARAAQQGVNFFNPNIAKATGRQVVTGAQPVTSILQGTPSGTWPGSWANTPEKLSDLAAWHSKWGGYPEGVKLGARTLLNTKGALASAGGVAIAPAEVAMRLLRRFQPETYEALGFGGVSGLGDLGLDDLTEPTPAVDPVTGRKIMA